MFGCTLAAKETKQLCRIITATKKIRIDEDNII
jgi:hypothetical protein